MGSSIENVGIFPTCQDIVLKAGADTTLNLTLNSAPVSDPDVFLAADLTSSTVIFTVKDSDGTVVLSKTNIPGEHVSDLDGKTAFDIVPSDTSGLVGFGDISSFYRYEVRRIDSGKTYVHLEGTLTINEAVGV